MQIETIPLDAEGLRILRAPAALSLQINRELLAVLIAPGSGVTVVKISPEQSLRESRDVLNFALQKLLDETAKNPGGSIQAKLFGLSSPIRLPLLLFNDWAKEKGVTVVDQDLGKGVVRTLEIEGSTGRVGVRYAESFDSGSVDFLAYGTASDRTFAPPTNRRQVLVLSTNKVTRQLCRQAIEEQSDWTAVCPDAPYDSIIDPNQIETLPEIILISEDVGRGKATLKMIARIHEEKVQTRILWLGSRPPKNSPLVFAVPKPKPSSVRKFKNDLRRSLQALVDSASGPGKIYAFRLRQK